MLALMYCIDAKELQVDCEVDTPQPQGQSNKLLTD